MNQKVQAARVPPYKPENIYAETMAMGRHYDTLSATVVGSIPLVLVGVFGMLHAIGTMPWRGLVPIAGALLTEVLYQLYVRLDMHASTAWNVANCLERGGVSDGLPVLGLASARHDIGQFPSLASKPGGHVMTLVRNCSRGSILIQFLLVFFWDVAMAGGLQWL